MSDTTINTLIDNLVTASDSAGFFRGMGSHHLDGLLRTRAEAREALKVVIAAALSALPARTDPEPETP